MSRIANASRTVDSRWTALQAAQRLQIALLNEATKWAYSSAG